MSRARALPPAVPVSALALLAPALAIGGCGTQTVRTERPALRLTLDEYRIVPQDVSVRPGRLKIIVHNAGRLTHNLIVQIPPQDPDDKAVELGRVDTAQPGESPDPIKLTLRPGRYRMVCSIANHDDLGQYGTLTVKR
ncbi:MAG: hypothetical protein M3296_10845 [Actinomycetota bacterium]|nr:hypothetical protein [Actinomycetota bacterium]